MTKERIQQIRDTLKTRSEGGVCRSEVGNGVVVRGGVEIIEELLSEVERLQSGENKGGNSSENSLAKAMGDANYPESGFDSLPEYRKCVFRKCAEVALSGKW